MKEQKRLIDDLHLEQCEAQGIELILENRKSTAMEVVECLVREEGMYMGDYVLGDTGTLEQVRFDRVEQY